MLLHVSTLGRDSLVGITTCYGLDGLGIEYQWEGRFSAPVQTGPGDHLASYTMGTGAFPGGKAAGGVALTTQPNLEPRLMQE